MNKQEWQKENAAEDKQEKMSKNTKVLNRLHIE